MKLKNVFYAFLKRFLLLGVFALSFFASSQFVFGSETSGTIDTTYKYAWGENIGWINFGCDDCDVTITDSAITGNAWSSQYGWINLNPTNSGVTNTSEGTLSGYAWSSNLGWINFSGVTINTSGEFTGYGTVKTDSSSINFNCSTGNSCGSADFKVKTDWRPASVRTTSSGGGTSSGSVPSNNPPITPPVTPTPTPTPSPVTPPAFPPVTFPTPPANNLTNIVNYLSSAFWNLVKPQPTPSAVVTVPKFTPFAFQLRWDLLPVRAINAFVFAPLPYEVRTLAAKFPELERTLKSVGIDRLTDLDKLSGVTFNLQGLTELEKTVRDVGVEKLTDINNLNGVSLDIPGLSGINGNLSNSIGTGKISLIKGLPVDKFPLVAKKNLPAEFVFARAIGDLVDLNVAVSVGEKGEVNQTISSLPGKTLKLVVKPISRARSVTGYFVFKSATPRISKTNTLNEISRASLTAGALLSAEGLVEKNPEPISIENKLVLGSFEYEDPDGDGIYTADVVSPVVPGEYEIITVIDYVDPVLGTRQMRMITVIDPEGYVFEKNNGKETRIPGAIVSLFELNNSTKQYQLWDAKAYQQENPQVTDVRGTYSFLVPEGSYYFEVVAPGYDVYEGKVFTVTEGSGVHQNIELGSGGDFFKDIDFERLLLIVVLLLLVYNLYKDKLSNIFKRNGK